MTVENQRLLQYFIYGLGMVVWFVLWKSFESLFDMVIRSSMMVPLVGPIDNLAPLLGLVMAVVAAEWVRRHPVTNKFGLEVLAEFRRVTWPNWKEVRGTTLVVLGVTAVISLILFFFDKIFDGVIGLMLRFI